MVNLLDMDIDLMTQSNRLFIEFLGLVCAVFSVGAWLIWFGIRKGFIENRIERREEVFEGPDAAKAGLIWIAIGLFGWFAVAVLVWAWRNGRVRP
jgi:Zn-dependent protease with chaperone function